MRTRATERLGARPAGGEAECRRRMQKQTLSGKDGDKKARVDNTHHVARKMDMRITHQHEFKVQRVGQIEKQTGHEKLLFSPFLNFFL